ncbi:MAG: sugar O-acetyltransferase [Bacteroidaceae bacterium]
MKTEKRKAAEGLLYDANEDAELLAERAVCADLLYELHQLRPSDTEKREAIFQQLFGKTKQPFTILPPFFCDYGYHIEIGKHFFANTNCVILDEAKVTFGDFVFIAPHCGFYTAGHPLDVEQRDKGLEIALPITIGNHVWIGGHVCVLPGVNIGDNTVIGAGSVVTKNIPANVLAAGNPCKVIREITEDDKYKYPQ